MKILTTIKNYLLRLFQSKPESNLANSLDYELVEAQMDEKDFFRQGILLTKGKYKDVIVTISPKVQLSIVNDNLHLVFDYGVVKNPNNVEIDYPELHAILGDYVVDLIQKDYDAFRISDTQHSSE